MKRIEGKIRKACQMYDLIAPGGRVAVGLSGGKDSVALLTGLCGYRRYADNPFEVVALTLDPCFGNVETDYSALTALCDKLGVEHHIQRTNLGAVIFDIRREKNPCALCAKMRRGILHDLSVALGCDRLALGHHMNDAVETFFLNLFHEGRIAAFAPKSYLSRKDITLIRPMILCTEAEVFEATRRAALPIVKSACPMDGVSQRQHVKEFIHQKEQEYPGFLQRSFTALQNADVSALCPTRPE